MTEPRHVARRSSSLAEARVRHHARVAAGLPGLWNYQGDPEYVGRHRRSS